MGAKRRIEAVVDRAEENDTTHPSRKRRYTEADAQLARLYDQLSDEVKATRIKAAAELIRLLRDAESSKLDTAITRLVRGLCSNRKAARSGFFVALVEIFSIVRGARSRSEDADLSPTSLFAKVESITQPESIGSKQEYRDHVLGRCLAFKAMIQSKILFSDAQQLTIWETVLDRIIGLAHANPWLRKDCGAVLFESLPTLAKSVEGNMDFVSILLQRLQSAGLIRTAEGLAIWLVSQRLFPSAAFPINVWHHGDPLSSKERAALAKVLRDNEPESADSDGTNRTSGRPQNTPSFAWGVVLEEFSIRYQKSSQSADFEKFWLECLDNSYFSANASTERKSVGLQILTLAVQKLPSALLPTAFSPNVMRCIINQRADGGHYLFQLARLPLDALVDRVKTDSTAAEGGVVALITGNGAINIDQLTKTKTIEELLLKASPEASSHILDVIEEVILQPKSSDHLSAEGSRRIAADILLSFVRKTGTPVGGTFPWTNVFDKLIPHAYLSSSPKTNPPFSSESSELFRNRVMSCLTHALTARLDPEYVLPHQIIIKIFKGQPNQKPSKTARTAVTISQRLKAQETKAAAADLHSIRAFRLLFDLSILQVYNGDTDATAVLDDLHACYESWQTSGENASLMLIEIVLSFISKPSTLFRKLAEQVFAAFASQIDEEGLQSMLDILDKKESLTGQQELFDSADKDGEGSGDASEEEIDGEDDSDFEVVDASDDGNEASGSNDESDEDEDESASDDDSADSGDEEQNAFESKLAEALKTSKASVANGDVDDSSSDESDMDDEQMMALDGHLTTIFRERTKQSSKKQDNKDAKENIVNFKSRVLDLLLILVKQRHSDILVLELIMPVLVLIRSTTAKQVSEKAFNVLKQLQDSCNKTKELPTIEEVEPLIDIIKAIHQELKHNASKMHSNACSRASLFLAKICINIDVKHYNEVADLYSQLQKEWYLDPRSNIQPSIFTEWTSWSIATKKR